MSEPIRIERSGELKIEEFKEGGREPAFISIDGISLAVLVADECNLRCSGTVCDANAGPCRLVIEIERVDDGR